MAHRAHRALSGTPLQICSLPLPVLAKANVCVCVCECDHGGASCIHQPGKHGESSQYVGDAGAGAYGKARVVSPANA